MNFLNSDFFSFIKNRFGSSTSVPRSENIKRAVASSKFCSIFFKLHNLVPMVNCHQQVHEQLDWMKSGQLFHPNIYPRIVKLFMLFLKTFSMSTEFLEPST